MNEHYANGNLERWAVKWAEPRARLTASLIGEVKGTLLDVAGYKGVLKSFLPNVDYTLIDMTNGHDLNQPMIYKDDAFDSIIAMDILGHVSEPKKLLAEIKRVLKPSGKALISIQKYHTHSRITEDDIRRLFIVERRIGLRGGVMPMILVPVRLASEVFYLVRK